MLEEAKLKRFYICNFSRFRQGKKHNEWYVSTAFLPPCLPRGRRSEEQLRQDHLCGFNRDNGYEYGYETEKQKSYCGTESLWWDETKSRMDLDKQEPT